jgi:2-aminobenzoate-CoA ligase
MKIDDVIPDDARPTLVFTLPHIHYPPCMNVAEKLVDANVKKGKKEKTAIYFENLAITYGELQEMVNRLGNGLKELGISLGDRVLLRSKNRPELIISILAIQKIGAIAVPTMHLFREKELKYILKDSRAKAVIVQDSLIREVRNIESEIEIKHVVEFSDSEGSISFGDVDGSKKLDAASTERDDIALILYTSGTTGTPKGVIHTHESIVSSADTFNRYAFKPVESDVYSGHPPIAFAYCYGGLMSYPFRYGATTSLIEDFTPEKMFETLEATRATIFFSVPTALNMMLRVEKAEKEYDLSALRAVSSAGEPLPPKILKEWMDRFHVPVVDNLGTTETLASFVSNTVDEIRPGTCGRPVPGYEIRIVDDSFKEVERGTIGRLTVRGPTGARYWFKEEEQRKYVRQGWTYIGDMAWMDDEGYVHYVARVDDIIISSGYRIAAPEVEKVLVEHEAVKEVAVIGVPDETRGQVVKACIVLSDGFEPHEELEKELKNFCKTTLAPYKYPRVIEFVDELPKTPTGKIRRRDLKV